MGLRNSGARATRLAAESGTRAVWLENGNLGVAVRPDLGGRIEDLWDLQSGKNWLWHPEGYSGVETRVLPRGASFDENWTGGWDEIFPNDAAGSFPGIHGGRMLRDHGELWSQSWAVIDLNPRRIEMSCALGELPVDVFKTVRLHESDPALEVEYRFVNRAAQPLPYLFKLHPALAVETGDEILMPGCLIEPVELGFSKWIGQPGRTRFPLARSCEGREIQVDRIPGPESGLQEFVYATELKEGWCGIRNVRTGTTLRFHFERSELPYVWLFQSYGGWRGHHVLVMEPCSNVPYDLEQALKQGTCAILPTKSSVTKHVRVEITTM